jgi:hypothetical protein
MSGWVWDRVSAYGRNIQYVLSFLGRIFNEDVHKFNVQVLIVSQTSTPQAHCFADIASVTTTTILSRSKTSE